MNRRKWMWRGVIGLVVVYGVFAGVSRQIHMNKLGRDLCYGSPSEKVEAARELMARGRLYEKVQEMAKEDRIKAMDAVQQISGKLTVEQCLILLKDTEADVRARVTKGLIVLGEDHIDLLVPAMRDSDGNVRNGAKDALVGIGPKVIPQVEQAAEDPDLLGAVCEVLVRLGEPGVPALVRVLEEGDQDMRMAAADSLGKTGSRTATPALVKATRDIPAVRRIAISSLCTICDPLSVGLLAEVLGHTRDDGEVRARAARALSVIGGPRATAALTGALDDWDLKVRTSVIAGLQRIGTPAVRPVVAAMSGGSPDVRHAGAAVLEKIDSRESASALLQLVHDGDPVVRASAVRGLGAQSSGVRMDLLVSSLSDREGMVADAAADSLVRKGNRAVPALISVLRSGAGDEVKYRAADALARIGEPAVPSLISILEANAGGSKWAAYSLGRTGDARAKPALEKFAGASDPDLAWVAQRALACL